jgi:hypothetical protein
MLEHSYNSRGYRTYLQEHGVNNNVLIVGCSLLGKKLEREIQKRETLQFLGVLPVLRTAA